jgi:IS30 family transposase
MEYKHLDYLRRSKIGLWKAGHTQAEIAKEVGVNQSTIYREVKRNSCTHWYSGQKYYWSHSAQKSYLKRRKRGLKLEKDRGLKDYVHSKLKLGWSPYQIEGRLKKENNGQCIISHETIYQYIYSNYDRRNRFYLHLRRQHIWRIKQGQRKPRIPKELLITERPAIINSRDEFGHWECDLMVFKKGVKANLITLRERKSRYMIAIKNQNREAMGTALALISTVKNMKNDFKSITFDQGSEFKRYEWIRGCLKADIYFCEPASPYQKGAVENGNSMLRIELPRTFDIENLKQKGINKIAKNINNRPLKCLNYQTPVEVFTKLSKS